MASRAELEAKKVAELKEECQKLGLAVGGKKSDLVDRILAAQAGDGDDVPAVAAPAAAAPAQAAAPAVPPPVAALNGEANGGGSGKHQRIEFTLDVAAEAEVAPKPANKIIKLGGEEAAAPVAKPEVAPVVSGDLEKVSVLSAEERKRLRGEKFGLSEDDKKKKRAQRFNLPDAEADEEKKLQRRQRFGITTDADQKAVEQAAKKELLDPAKLKARAERFGVGKPVATGGMSDEAKKKARAARFKAAA